MKKIGKIPCEICGVSQGIHGFGCQYLLFDTLDKIRITTRGKVYLENIPEYLEIKHNWLKNPVAFCKDFYKNL